MRSQTKGSKRKCLEDSYRVKGDADVNAHASKTCHLCYHREKDDGTCDLSTCLFDCFQSQQPSDNYNRDLSRVVNQMGHGRICTCVPSFENFVCDVNHVRIYTDYAILRRMHQQISDHEDCQAHPHGKSPFA